MTHCELLGYSMSEDECKETRSNDFNECQDCTGEKKMAIKPEVKAEARCECGKKASEDKHFRFKRGKCCACVAREDRAKKAVQTQSIASVLGEKRERKPKAATPIVTSSTTPSPPYQGGEPKIIALDFSRYPELFETLLTLAKKEMRTPEMQALYLLKEGDSSGLSKARTNSPNPLFTKEGD